MKKRISENEKRQIVSAFCNRHPRFSTEIVSNWIHDYIKVMNGNLQGLYPAHRIPWELSGSPGCSWTVELKNMVDEFIKEER